MSLKTIKKKKRVKLSPGGRMMEGERGGRGEGRREGEGNCGGMRDKGEK